MVHSEKLNRVDSVNKQPVPPEATPSQLDDCVDIREESGPWLRQLPCCLLTRVGNWDRVSQLHSTSGNQGIPVSYEYDKAALDCWQRAHR